MSPDNSNKMTIVFELYAKYAMPAPGRPLFQAATATFNPNSATKVNVANTTRGPLLLISGAQDNTAPPVLIRSTLRVYRKSPAAATRWSSTAAGASWLNTAWPG